MDWWLVHDACPKGKGKACETIYLEKRQIPPGYADAASTTARRVGSVLNNTPELGSNCSRSWPVVIYCLIITLRIILNVLCLNEAKTSQPPTSVPCWHLALHPF